MNFGSEIHNKFDIVPTYTVGVYGTVKRIKLGGQVHQRTDTDGRKYVNLYVNKVFQKQYIDDIVNYMYPDRFEFADWANH